MSGEKGRMARRLVYFCIGMLTVTTVWAAVLKSAAPSTDLSDILTFVGAAYGGELLMLLAKRIFAKPNKEVNEDEGDFDEAAGEPFER